jgi:hypothetical protein
MQWKHPSSPSANKFMMKPLANKLMLTIFWDSRGPILETYLEHGTTVTSAIYCDMFQRELIPAIHSKRRGRLSEGVSLHYNDHPHTLTHTLRTLRKFKWEIMEHPAHSSNLMASDFQLLGLLKEALGRRRFQCDEGIKNAVHQWLHAQTKIFYYGGIKKLVGCWEKYVEKQGDYVEKLLILFL